MPSAGNVVLSGFSGSGSNIDNFESLRGSWSVKDGEVVAGKNFRALLVNKTACTSGPFSISVTIKPTGPESTWNGVVVNLRPNDTGNGHKFLTFRVRQGASVLKEWQLLAVDTTTSTDTDADILSRELLSGSEIDTSKPWRVTLFRNQADLQFRIEQDNKEICAGTLPQASQVPWPNDSRIGVYSFMGGGASFSDFQATTTSGVFDTFFRDGVPGTVASQQLAGGWQEDLGDWLVGSGSARSMVLDGSVKAALLLFTQPVDNSAQALLSADVKIEDADVWTGLVFGAKNASANTHPDNYFAFQVKANGWQVTHEVLSPRTTTVLGSSDKEPRINAGGTYRLCVQLDSSTSVRVSVTQNGNPVLAEQSVKLESVNGARFGIVTGSTRNSFTQIAAAPIVPKPKEPPIIKTNTNAVWTPNATYWSSPYKVSPFKSLDKAIVNCAYNNSEGTPEQCLYTVTDVDGTPLRQYVGYYATGGTVAITRRSWSRPENKWGPFEPSVPLDTRLPEPDRHYRIAVAESADGHVHVAANMWASPLTYYRTTKSGDIRTLQKASMGSSDDTSATYPAFVKIKVGAEERLLFLYRSGGSGNGVWILNKYVNQTWSRDSTLFDNKSASGKTYNAYPTPEAPLLGPDGKTFHFAWMWRSTEFAQSNSRICYAYSEDLQTWRSASGTLLGSPLSYDDKNAIVDDVPELGGALNSLLSLGFDYDNKPVIGYVKFDSPALGNGATDEERYKNGPGSSQFYVSRWRNGGWQCTQLTNYLGRWAPWGAGSIDVSFQIAGAAAHNTSTAGTDRWILTLPYIYGPHGGTFVLDADTLEVIGEQDWPSYSALVPAPKDMQDAVTTDSSNATFGASKDEEYVLYNFTVGRGVALPEGADTSMQVLRVK